MPVKYPILNSNISISKKSKANVNIGVLEKSYNRKSKSFIFTKLSECQHYQAKYGGAIHIIQKLKQTEESIKSSLDEDQVGLTRGFELTRVGDSNDILLINSVSQLRHGSR